MSQAEEALRDAAFEGDLATLKRLVEEGVDLEAKDDFGETALMHAACGGKLDRLDLLIAKGAKLDATENHGKWTALHFAACDGHAPCVEALLKAGADARLKTQRGETALDLAKEEGHTQVIALLENAAAEAVADKATRGIADLAVATKDFDLFISHYTKDDSHTVFMQVSAFMSARDKVIFNPTTHLSHAEQINKEAMASAVRRSKLVIAALSEGFFESKWCEAEIEAARKAGIKAKQVDRWVEKYKAHPNFAYIFRENGRDVLNKQNPGSVTATLKYLATLC